MEKSEVRYIIDDYCTRYEIDITEEQLREAADAITEKIEEWEEYNYRCGIHSVNVDIILDNYFENLFEDL